MASKNKNLSVHKAWKAKHASGFKVGVVVSEYNEEITHALRDGCIQTLTAQGVKQKNISLHYAPGAFELPLAACWLFAKKKVDAVIVLGCVIKGDTDHDIYINQAVSEALMTLSIETGKPFVFGVITPNSKQQALERAGGKHGNKGVECAIAALKMLELKKELSA